MMSKAICALAAAFLATLCVTGAGAQSTDQNQQGTLNQSTASNPPVASSADGTEATPDSAQLSPDQLPLSGVQQLTLGTSGEPRSFLVPGISVITQLVINPISSVNFLLGHLDLQHHVSSGSELVLDYTGGGVVTNDPGGDSVIQDLNFHDSFQWQRWSLLVGDEGSYVSESTFGFGGVGGLGSLGSISGLGVASGGIGILPSLNAFLTPSQTIQTAHVARLSNTALSQVGYQLSPRSSWTAAVAYGLLRFHGEQFIDSNNALFTTGYNYQVSEANTLGLIYRFADFRFTHFAQRIDEQVVSLAYARRVTGRLSLKLAAGPSLVTFREPLSGSARNLSWDAITALIYKLGRNTLSLSYDHYLTAGSGLLLGAHTDQVMGMFTRSFSPTWQGSLSFGYASNRGLAQTTASSIEERFNDWFVTIHAQHQLRPGMVLFLIYGARLLDSTTAACSTSTCGSNYISQTLSLHFNWSLHPIPLGR